VNVWNFDSFGVRCDLDFLRIVESLHLRIRHLAEMGNCGKSPYKTNRCLKNRTPPGYSWLIREPKYGHVRSCYDILECCPIAPLFIDIEPWLHVWPFAHTSFSEPNNLVFSPSFYLSLFSCIMMYSVHHFAKDVKNHWFMLIHEYLWKSSFHVAHIFFGEGCLNSVTVGKSSAPFF